MNCILLALSESDVKNLPNAARALKAIGTQNVWLIYSPAITVSLAEATATFDKDITDLKAAMAAAKDRDDFDGAKKLKLDLEGKQLERKQAIGDAWKRVKIEDRKKKAAELFAEFYGVCGQDLAVKPYMTVEHHDAPDLPNLLNLYQKENPFGTGNFGIHFGRELGRNLTSTVGRAKEAFKKMVAENAIHTEGRSVAELFKGEPPTHDKKEPKPKFDPTRAFTGAELEALPHFSLMAVAKNRGVATPKGMPKEEIVKEILGRTAAAY